MPSSQRRQCPICHEALSDRATVMPCKHEFDHECIKSWVHSAEEYQATGSTARKCPYCRGPIVSLRYNYSADGWYSTEVIGPASAPPQADERITVGMSERERHAALERRRLRALEPWEVQKFAEAPRITVRQDHFHIDVERSFYLEIKQGGLQTTSTLIRTLSLKYHHDHLTNLHHTPSHRPNDIRDFQGARDLVDETLWQLAPRNPAVVEGDLQLRNVEIYNDKRGLHLFLRPELKFKRNPLDANVELEWTTILEEEGPARTYYDMGLPEENARSYDWRAMEIQIREVTEEVQSIIEWLGRRGEWPDHELDKATTNLREAYQGHACRYCHRWHRTGDCLLPEDETDIFDR